LAHVRLPQDVKEALRKAYKEEVSETGKVQLEAILKNIELAEKENTPMCQDTGVVAFMVKVGDKFPLKSELKEIFTKATRRATEEIPIRPNAVDMLKGNTNDNTGSIFNGTIDEVNDNTGSIFNGEIQTHYRLH
jgi:fumarate hydratase subunit alpha